MTHRSDKTTRVDTSAGNEAVIIENVQRPDHNFMCMELMSASLWVAVEKENTDGTTSHASFFLDLDDAEQALATMLNAVRSQRERLGV